MEATVHTFGLNGQIVKPYTRKQIGQIAKPDPSAPKEIPTSLNLQLGPPLRSDLADIMAYFAKQEATANWTRSSYEAPKRISTDDLVREFLTKSLQEENARRAIAEAEADMPYSGVLARQLEQQRLATEALAPRQPRGATTQRSVEAVSTPQRRVGSSSSSASSPPLIGTPTGVEGLTEMQTRFFTPRAAARTVSFARSDDEEGSGQEEPPTGKPRRGRPLGSKNKPKPKMTTLDE
jgi:hypothetical protein